MPDKVGNLYRTIEQTDRKYGKGGKLLESNGAKYNYDEEGNLISKITAKGGEWLYAWAGNGMLKKVTRPDKKEVHFEYDALGRRTAKILKPALSRGESIITRWVWDGNTPLHEWKYNLNDRPVTVVNEFGDLVTDKAEPTESITSWIFDEGSFKPAAKIEDGKLQSIITDYLGTPVEMFDGDGNQTWSVDYDIYGKIRKQDIGNAIDCPFRYQGQYEDEETGLYYNRFRYYSAEEGMYLSQDPIGLLGNNPNFYAYTYDSNICIDLLGLNDCMPTKFHKRTVGEVAELRKAFDKSGGAREEFLKKLAQDPNAVNKYGQDAVNLMKKGNVPENMVVHHKKPLFRGGTNDNQNLTLLDKKYHSENNKALHWYEEGNNPYGLND